jgi:hypothetical protein
MPTRAELIWDGKYDANGKRVAPLRVALPFQTVETVNESAQDRVKNLALFYAVEREKPWRNRLIWGDKKYVLPSLLPEFAGKVNLIYIDPPFDTGADFSFTATVPAAEDDDADGTAFTKEPSIIEQKAYRDTWGRGLDSYLQWLYETVLLYELLAETGSIYVHLDWHVGHYAKAILDEVFGTNNCINEIVWKRSDAHNDAGQGATFTRPASGCCKSRTCGRSSCRTSASTNGSSGRRVNSPARSASDGTVRRAGRWRSLLVKQKQMR